MGNEFELIPRTYHYQLILFNFLQSMIFLVKFSYFIFERLWMGLLTEHLVRTASDLVLNAGVDSVVYSVAPHLFHAVCLRL